jgi:phosphatidylglycerol:prolipoprotein diacylglycerol transferase
VDGWAENALQQVLGHGVTTTCWLDPGDTGDSYPVSVMFTGRRAGAAARPRQGDIFSVTETVSNVVPGGGPVSVTAKVRDVTPGEWIVWARPNMGTVQGRAPGRPLPTPPVGRGLRRQLWSKGNPVPAGNSGTRVATRPIGFATGPGLVPASWAPLVALGVVAALAVQAVLAGRAHLNVGAALGVSLAASVAGAAGARAWYVALNRGKAEGLPTQGLCIQGFIAAAAAVLITGLALAGLPVRTFLDISAPGLFFGMAIGRQGCFLHGCCTGRLTASRWGVWASDGRVGARRAPVQQLESLACLVIGLAALLLVLRAHPAAGTIFTGALAAYTVCRQVLFRYREEPRRTSLGRRASLIGAGLVLIADIIAAIVALGESPGG